MCGSERRFSAVERTKKAPTRGWGAEGVGTLLVRNLTVSHGSCLPNEMAKGSFRRFEKLFSARRSRRRVRNKIRRDQSITILVAGLTWLKSRRRRDFGIATHPAVGARPGRARWMNTALPRRATLGCV